MRSTTGGENDTARQELAIRLAAFQLNQRNRWRPLPPSRNLEVLRNSIVNCKEAQEEEIEGHCAPEQLEFLRGFVRHQFASAARASAGLILCQIGFNAGHSALALLDQAPEGSVLLSLDLGKHGYTRPLEKTVASLAKARGQTHVLLLGDSAEMLPRFRSIEFDLIFIDGNHAYEAVKLDFLNCLSLARPDTLILLNHVFTEMLEGVHPTRVWLEAVGEGQVEQIGWHSCCSRHGVAIGRPVQSQHNDPAT